MRERALQKLKQNSAFTLMEMMIAVAIVIVLLGISILSITDWTKKMKMTELDNYAKNVYLEAQNQLASMEVEGSLAKLYNGLSVEGGTYYEEYSARKLTNMPADYDDETFGDYYKNMYYFTSEDSMITTFVPEISLSDENGCYLIEIHPESGDVYGVFYWETDNTAFTGTPAQIYAAICGMEKADAAEHNRELASRMEYAIGYYGGVPGAAMSSSSYQLNQKVEVVNGEELYLKISYDYNDRVMEHIDGVDDGKVFDINITITGETSGAVWNPVFDIKDNYYYNSATNKIETGLLLDGMGAGQNFATIIADAKAANKVTGDFLPGETLEISVKTVYQYDNIKLKEQSGTYRANSLFADVTDKTIVKEDDEVLERTIGINTVRHLKNLGGAYYNGSIVETSKGKSVDEICIEQKNDIDFNNAEYVFMGRTYTVKQLIDGEVYAIPRPVAAIAPISNSAIFENAEKTVTVDGMQFAIKNLVVNADSENAGLFAVANGVTFKNVKLEDYILNASGCTNVGALIGKITGGSIEYSGVYLAPFYRDAGGAKHYYIQDTDADYGTVMARHYATMGVTGGTNVGGLIGNTNGTAITDCYAAVQVKGNTNVGGLIGRASGQTIKNSYASGDVKHLSASGTVIGGMIGKASTVTVRNAYATGDVWGGNQMGGFVGVSDGGYFAQCSSYGEIKDTRGNTEFSDTLQAGGFVSDIGNNDGVVDTLGYLAQVGYNADETRLKDSGLKKEYAFFADAASSSTAKAISYPYDGNLLYKAFPFKLVTDNHYGDWPSQYYINTSLVYYEKYAGGAYGFYSVTKLTDTTASETENDNYVWVLDSLKEETCVEDGYALLSMFYLDSVDYSVYQNVDETWSPAQDADGNGINGTLKTSMRETGEPTDMVLLQQQGALVFNAYDAVENPYSANYDGMTKKSSFSTNGMYLYQLPYELQNTYRYNVDNFYDVIVFDEGYAVGNLKSEEDGEAGGTPVISQEAYYYCPHFSKLAINPGMGANDNIFDENGNILSSQIQSLEAPYMVYVRSARQLNALGRVPYYWNDKGGGTDLITYEQEVDINFSSYTNGTKKYCGRDFNLLAFDTKYANQPIGQRASDTGSYGAFQNDYHGNYHKIIDYCVKSSNQYVGLFGEIYKDDGATQAQIRDVVMMVSPENVGNTGSPEGTSELEQNNAGLIIGNYQEKSTATGNNRQRTGVGALVGSDYTKGIAYTSDSLKANEENIIYTVYNCAVTGYQVQYHILNLKDTGYQQPLGIALGGMLGYSRGNIAHSTALNDVKLVAEKSLTGDTAAIMIGGFSGSSFYGTTLNCYAGGTIDVETKYDEDIKSNAQLTRLRIGGFCPGWLDAKDISGDSSGSADVSYINVYSYAEVQSRVWDISETFDHLMPTVSRMRLYYKYKLFNGTKWHTEYENGDSAASVPGVSYYLNTVITEGMLDDNSSDATRYYEYKSRACPKTCDPATYAQLSNEDFLKSNNGVTFIFTEQYADIKMKEEVSVVPLTSDFDGKSYPFPAFTYYLDQVGNKVYVHYGDWPLAPEE